MRPDWYEYSGARRYRCLPPDPAATEFHRRSPGYAATPLVDCPDLARSLGVGRLLVKDESERFGLPSFKVLGASWAIFRGLSGRVGGQPGATFAEFAERMPLSPITLVAATEGNHGRAVAHVARLAGLRCRIFVPEIVSDAVVAAIGSEGAEVVVVAGPYDEAVRRAADAASRAGHDALMVQDTAWWGYTEIPGWVVEGYSTLFAEIDEALGGSPGAGTVISVPVGVGSLLQAAVSHYRSGAQETPPALLGVEPDTADCVLQSLVAGELKTVQTGATTMTGLNCGTPSSLAWPLLRNGVDAAVAVSDDEAERAVAELADAGIRTRPTGAAALAGARAALTGEGSDARRQLLGVGDRSTVVVLCTEGATPRG